MLTFLLSVALWVVHGGHAGGNWTEWYVSGSGQDSAVCGNLSYPCQDLAHVIARALDHDVIYIDGSDTNYVYSLCYRDFLTAHVQVATASLEKSVALIGHFGQPRLTCKEKKFSNDTISMFRKQRADDKCLVILKNLLFESGVLSVSNCTIYINDSSFHNASVVTTEPCLNVGVHISNSTWMGEQVCDSSGTCSNHFINNITCWNTKLTIRHSTMLQTQTHVNSGRETQILVMDSLFSNDMRKIQFLGGLHFTFFPLDADILIQNSVFENQVHPTRVQSVTNLYEASVWLKAEMISRTNFTSKAKALICNCTFINNERGLTVVGAFRELMIKNCTFESNMAMHAGSAILILINKDKYVFINNCTFSNNVAGEYRKNYPIMEKEGGFEVVGNEVHLNADCCKGVITLVGKGGAIRAQRGNVVVTSCTFLRNTAKLLGGSVFVDIDATLNINKSKFENTHGADEHALQGDVLYSDGQMKVDDMQLVVNSAMNGLSILRHSGDHWSLDIRNVWIQCPVGYDLRTTNSSAYGVSPFGLRRSYKLDQLSYFCESCPRNKYSLDYGYLNYTMVFNDFAYFTLLINGSVPKPQYTGKFLHHEIQCEDCPYGGHCVQGITSVANFWGFTKGKTVKFQHCPKGYCCSTPHCPSINACVDRRQGRLCGRCLAGFSEGLFSPVCVSNDKCGPTWLYPFAVSLAVFYTIFLLFQTDLKNFLFSATIFCQCKPQTCLLPCEIGCGEQNSHHNLKNGRFLNSMSLRDRAHETRFVQNGVREHDELRDGPVADTMVTSTSTPAAQHSQIQTLEEKEKESAFEFHASDSGFLIILFYYFQDALLLQVNTVYVITDSSTQRYMKSILTGLFKFELDLFDIIEEVCVVPNMTVVPRTLTKSIIVPCVIFMFGFIYVLHRWGIFLQCSNKTTSTVSNNPKKQAKSFMSSLSSGFILALLFTYQKLGTTTFNLLNCVPVESDMVLFIDGEVTCYQYWQYGVMAYAATCVTPFFLVLTFGPTLMIRGYISLAHFFIACLFPLPFLLAWVVLVFGCQCPRWKKKTTTLHVMSEGSHAVMSILQGPFQESKYGICWSGIVIGRRLVLILLFTFVNDSLIRILAMLLACFIILLHHVHAQPYKDKRGNIAATTSAAALVTLGSINLVRAGFEAAEYNPTGPNAFLMTIFAEIENALLLWAPMAIMVVVTLLFMSRLLVLLFRQLCTSQLNSLEQLGGVLKDSHILAAVSDHT